MTVTAHSLVLLALQLIVTIMVAPGNLSASTASSIAAEQSQDHKDANTTIRETLLALERDPENHTAKEKLIKLFQETGDYKLCVKEFQKLLKREPKNASFYSWVGYCYAQQNNLEEAQRKSAEYFKKATELDPKNPKYFSNLGHAHVKLGVLHHKRGVMKRDELEKAITYFKDALALRPDHKEAATGLASTFAVLGQYDEGIQTLEAYLLYDKRNPEIYRWLVNLAIQKKDTGSVFRYLKNGLEIDPNNVDFNLQLGQVYASRGELDLAEEQAAKLAHLDAQKHKELNEDIELVRLEEHAREYLQKNEYDQAIEEYRRLLREEGDRDIFYAGIAYVYRQKGDLEKASENYRIATEFGPDKPRNFYNLGLTYEAQGRWREARYAFEHVVTLNPTYYDTSERLKRVSVKERS